MYKLRYMLNLGLEGEDTVLPREMQLKQLSLPVSPYHRLLRCRASAVLGVHAFPGSDTR